MPKTNRIRCTAKKRCIKNPSGRRNKGAHKCSGCHFARIFNTEDERTKYDQIRGRWEHYVYEKHKELIG